MAYNPLSISETINGAPIDQALLQNIKDNFDHHNTKVVAAESSLPLTAGIGEVKMSMLPEAQFASQNLGTWLLMDGRGCAGTPYSALTGNNNVPDARGQFLRMKNHGRTDAHRNRQELGIGTQQSQDWKDFYMSNNNIGAGYTHGFDGNQKSTVAHTANRTFGGGWSAGGNINWYWDPTAEFRPANLTMNFFIKVNN